MSEDHQRALWEKTNRIVENPRFHAGYFEVVDGEGHSIAVGYVGGPMFQPAKGKPPFRVIASTSAYAEIAPLVKIKFTKEAAQ